MSANERNRRKVPGKITPAVYAFLMRALLTGLMAALLLAPVAHAQPPAKPDRAASCKPVPPRARIKVTLKPDTEVADLIAWYSTLTCAQMVVPGDLALAGKKVTILSPTPVTLAELERLFLGALESVGLTVERDGKFVYVIDAARARHGKTPIVR